MKQASAGDARAACLLGDASRAGDGMEQSWEHAFRWYTLGARGGDAEAQNNLGTLYLEGFYCPEDHEQAVYWYRKSPAQGISVAHYNLGMRYIHGQGVPADYVVAMRWLEKSAEGGYNLADYDLGIMHLHGEGCTPDLASALRLFMKGAVGGDDRAIKTLLEKVPELEELAIEGDIDACIFLADFYSGHLNNPDFRARGWAWFLWAEAHLVSSEAAGKLAEFLEDKESMESTTQADKEMGQKLFKAMMHEKAIAVPPEPGTSDVLENNGTAARWRRVCDLKAPIEQHFSEKRPNFERVLELCAEGGGLDLFGSRGSDGSWSFWSDLNDWTPTMEDDPAIRRTSGLVHSWDAAIASLDKTCNHWISLYPCYVHPEFRMQMLAIIERRLIVKRLAGMYGENE